LLRKQGKKKKLRRPYPPGGRKRKWKEGEAKVEKGEENGSSDWVI